MKRRKKRVSAAAPRGAALRRSRASPGSAKGKSKSSLLARELAEALEQQAATSEVLRVISSSPGELEPVFQTMLENAVRICEAKFGILFRFEGDVARPVAMLGVAPEFAEFIQRGIRPSPITALGRAAMTKRATHITDLKAEPGYGQGDPMQVAGVKLAG